MTEKIYRQGDTLLREFDSNPFHFDARKIVNDGKLVILAYGEKTGHRHVLNGSEICGFHREVLWFDLFRTDGCPHYVEVGGSGAILQHQNENGQKAEHDEIFIPKGIYESALQVEESTGFLNKVAD
ncbi:MAG: hypothetical protein J0L55_13710 [Caulobacterales bacterium]|nr:hypothetical protein [Caulobacterales bacterium]